MNTTAFHSSIGRSALLLAWVGFASAATAAETYENHIDLSGSYSDVSGHEAGYQKKFQSNSGGSGGIEDLFYTNTLSNDATLTLKGRALAGDNDYLLDLAITKDDLGYLKLGYSEYRVWFDGMGGYHPANGFSMSLYNEDLHLDRGNFWFEAGYTPADKINFVLRYDLFTRKGTKDSTAWGDTGLAINSSNTRALLPSFYKIDEKRHQITATLSQKRVDDKWELGVRYDNGDYTNSRNERRRAGEGTSDKVITHKEGRDYDLFMIRGSYVNKIHEQLTVTTAVSRTKFDTTISGTRIFGADYDPVYDPNYANRAYRDEGILDLSGDTEMTQTLGVISALYQPNQSWSIIPSLRMENIDWSSMAEFVETNFTNNTAKLPDNTEIETTSDKSWKNIGESIEARYRGLENVSLNFKAEWVQADGDLTEELIDEPGTATQAVVIDRDTEFDRNSQKYSITTNWYPMAGTTLAVQYYYKGRENDYHSPRDSTVSTADRYPAYIANQDFETNDFNVRLTYRASPQVRLVTRYDYQKSKIFTQDVGGTFGQSADMTSHILAETVSYNPLDRWYILGSVNYVWDQLTTPAVGLTGTALNRVKNSDANYMNFTLSSGYAIDEGSDLYVDYSLYRAIGDYIDNSADSVAYGSKARTHQAGLTWFRRLDSRTALTVRYAYAKNDDDALGALADYEAHLLYAKVQYRF